MIKVEVVSLWQLQRGKKLSVKLRMLVLNVSVSEWKRVGVTAGVFMCYLLFRVVFPVPAFEQSQVQWLSHSGSHPLITGMITVTQFDHGKLPRQLVFLSVLLAFAVSAWLVQCLFKSVCPVHIIRKCEGCSDPILSPLNCSQTHQSFLNNIKHVWWLWFKIWMIASVFSEPDHTKQRESHLGTAGGAAKAIVNILALEANVS